MRFAFIDAERGNYPLRCLRRAMGVSRSGYYAWRVRKTCQRIRDDVKVKAKMVEIQREQRGLLGVPRMQLALERVMKRSFSKDRVRRLMREAGVSYQPKKRFVVTTTSDKDAAFAPNVLARRFNPARPNVVWATDITYIGTKQGWLYLAVVIDLFSRAVVGWAFGPSMRTDLVKRALQMALQRRNPPRGLLHHSDRGCQYTAGDYANLLNAIGATTSMSRKGNCWDNAVVESFFATLKSENPSSWESRQSAMTALALYIQNFYNRVRMHSYIGGYAPLEFEQIARSRMAD